MSEAQKRIDSLFNRLQSQKIPTNPTMSIPNNGGLPFTRPLSCLNTSGSPVMSRPRNLTFVTIQNDDRETERKLKEIMQISGNLTINGVLYKTDIKDMEDLEELGNGTCGHVVKMRHKPSENIIAVKQMRRSGNSDETKRIIMDIEVVLKSHDCKYIVHCLGCFITESEVWICMELMDTCFDKLLKRFKQPIPEGVLGKVTVATVEALSYLKDKHGVIHRDVKPSNILLDLNGNVKLCDFGISGRLVDSMAKTRSAGCAAYMAPERIEPDPQNPDYDVRADVWSLGITLVELATGSFPYQDCKTDFEVLAKVIGQDPPSLPMDKEFSSEFREFVSCCLKKDKKHRPKYTKLKNHPFIKKHETVSNVSVRDWYVALIRNAEEMTNRAAPRQSTSSLRQFFSQHLSSEQQPPLIIQSPSSVSPYSLTNGSAIDSKTIPTDQSDHRVPHNSRLSSFQRSGNPSQLPPPRIDSPYQSNSISNVRSYSPYQAYQNHIASLKDQANKNLAQDKSCYSPLLPRRSMETSANNSSYLQHRRVASETRWRSPNSSPLQLRSQCQAQTEESQYAFSNVSPMILQRFYHQQKQQQMVKEAEESGKTRFASYIKMQLTGDRSGRSSRHQSPEPPPRLSRRLSSENQSPLAVRRNVLENQVSNSPSLSRRYVSPTPPVPPPRKLSESSSVPGSPQHVRARFHYTPEPQRRLFQNNDIS